MIMFIFGIRLKVNIQNVKNIYSKIFIRSDLCYQCSVDGTDLLFVNLKFKDTRDNLIL